jgi:hypothetical protein
MTRRFIVLSLMLLAVSQARAVVEVEMPLAQLVKDSQIIAVVRLEQVDAEKARGSLTIERTLQGGNLPASIPIKLVASEEGEGSPRDMLERVSDGTALVLFLSSLSAKEHQVFAYGNGSWYKLRGVDELDRLKLMFVQGEPYLRRTFHGDAAELAKLLDNHLANTGELPGLDKAAKPGLGPRLDEASPRPEPVVLAPDQIVLGPAWQTDGDAKATSTIMPGSYLVMAVLLAAGLGLVVMLTRSLPGGSA